MFITIILPSAVLGTHIILQYSLPHGPLINDCFQYNGVWTIHLQLISQHGEVLRASYVLSFWLLFASSFLLVFCLKRGRITIRVLRNIIQS